VGGDQQRTVDPAFRASTPFLERLTKLIVTKFLVNGHSVSIEVFESCDDGVRAIGTFGEA